MWPVLRDLFVKLPKVSSTRNYTVRAAELKLPQSTSLLEYIWRGIESRSGAGTAIYCAQTGQRIGYESLRTVSSNVAAWLSDNCPGSLAMLLPNGPEAAVSALAALEAGVPLAAFNPQSTVEELAVSLALTRSEWLVTKSSLVHAALEAKVAVEQKTKENYPLKIISVDDNIVFNGIVRFGDLTKSSGTLIDRKSRGDTALLSQVWSDRHGLETVLVSKESLLASCLQTASPHLTQGETLASNIPIFTRYGLAQTLLAGLSAGAEVVILPPSKDDINGALNICKPSVASLVPSSLPSIKSNIDSLKCIIVPGLLSRETVKNLPQNIAERITQHYGPPEGPVIFSQPVQEECTRLGQPVPGTEVQVTVAGGEVGVMSEGEIWVRGPQFGSSENWIFTGDTGYYDPEGTFYLTRSASMNVDGLAVWPAELESVLRANSGVAAVAVFGTGHMLVAAVIPADPYNPPDINDLKLWLSSKTAPHKKVSEIFFTSSLPTTDSGEFDKNLLASRFLNPLQYAAVTAV